MRNFIFDVWVWSKAKHSRLLKQIRVKALSFPSDIFCLNEAAKDADVNNTKNMNYYSNYETDRLTIGTNQNIPVQGLLAVMCINNT